MSADEESEIFDYKALDAAKRVAIQAARATAGNAEQHGRRVVPWGWGESFFLLEEPDRYSVHVMEGLGTKGVLATADELGFGYGLIGRSTIGAIANDLIPSGGLPILISMFLAAGEKSLENTTDVERLMAGWREGCMIAGAVWGGGETMLHDRVLPEDTVIAGAAFGSIEPKSKVIKPQIQIGDRIILLHSSGLHDNGYTPARKLVEKLPQKYRTKMYGGDEYGVALLQPTRIYVPVMRALMEADVPIHYAVNITGHGWSKLMRAAEPFIYVIERLPPLHTVFQFIMETGQYSKRKMYRTYNMGAGFALIVPELWAERVVEIAGDLECPATDAGYIEKRGDEKRVVILPDSIELDASTFQVR